jgi:hypothetical protein
MSNKSEINIITMKAPKNNHSTGILFPILFFFGLLGCSLNKKPEAGTSGKESLS